MSVWLKRSKNVSNSHSTVISWKFHFRWKFTMHARHYQLKQSALSECWAIHTPHRAKFQFIPTLDRVTKIGIASKDFFFLSKNCFKGWHMQLPTTKNLASFHKPVRIEFGHSTWASLWGSFNCLELFTRVLQSWSLLYLLLHFMIQNA